MMVRVDPKFVTSKEVLGWKGIHLFHFWFSSCSQKVRLFLRLKSIPWTSHVINLRNQENHNEWYLGINPRGLVPCLVDDGDVHIESNDIMQYLENKFPDPPLLPMDDFERDLMMNQLKEEDNLHMELRALTFAFLAPKKMNSLLKFTNYKNKIHPSPIANQRSKDVKFYEDYINKGITPEQIVSAYNAWREKFSELNGKLNDNSPSNYMAGSKLSLLDIAWFVNVDRLQKCGYPVSHHPRLLEWYNGLLSSHEGFKEETQLPRMLQFKAVKLRIKQKIQKKAMLDIVNMQKRKKKS
mmetsp:Transcript_41227/g.54241  ORF Transcript_41227/g.54241 Transcript_41227/m.54241 type:complete len:296 (+) Transcript_41227:43-930(+)